MARKGDPMKGHPMQAEPGGSLWAVASITPAPCQVQPPRSRSAPLQPMIQEEGDHGDRPTWGRGASAPRSFCSELASTMDCWDISTGKTASLAKPFSSEIRDPKSSLPGFMQKLSYQQTPLVPQDLKRGSL